MCARAKIFLPQKPHYAFKNSRPCSFQRIPDRNSSCLGFSKTLSGILCYFGRILWIQECWDFKKPNIWGFKIPFTHPVFQKTNQRRNSGGHSDLPTAFFIFPSPCTESLDNREFPTIGIENMNPELYKAAIKGNVRDLTRIVECNNLTRIVECNNLELCLTPQKNTVLHIAVEFGRKNIVVKVIELCRSLIYQHNSKGDTPLHKAARAGSLDLTKLLTPPLNSNSTEGNPALEAVRQAGCMALMKRNSEGNNPIHEALKKRHEKVALHLLAFETGFHGLAFQVGHQKLACDVNDAGESLLYLAAEAGLDEVVKKIIDSGDYSTRGPDGQNPLHIAVIKGRLGVVRILLDRENNGESNFIPQADRFDNRALHYASATGYEGPQGDRIQVLKLLLKANQSLAYVPNINGDYPLFIAVRNDFLLAVATILVHCPDSAELVNQEGQNALHLAVMEKKRYIISRPEFKKLINEPDNSGNTPMHLATLTNQEEMVDHLIRRGPDLTMSNKEGLTAMDICGYTETEHPIRDALKDSGAVPGRHRWQERCPPSLGRFKTKKISPEFKTLGLQTLPIVTSLVATVTFAAAFTVPGGYKNDGPREGVPVFMRNTALQAFVLSDTLAFCSSMAATVLLVYANARFKDANARFKDAFKVYWTLQTCYYISGVAILATITAFVTAVYVLTSKESLWLADASLVLGFGVPLFLAFAIDGF